MGESPLFPPQYQNEQEAALAILHVIRRKPELYGYRQSRWTLSMIAACCDWLKVTTEGGLWYLLKRLGISYKRGRDYVHSPDRYYWEKLSLLNLAKMKAFYDPERFIFLYLDQLTYYRQPTLARAYELKGEVQPLARRSYRPNTMYRTQAAMNAFTGQVIYDQRSHTNLEFLSRFWVKIRAAYPKAEQIYIALDNWPVQFHPDVLARLQPQDFPFPLSIPPNWPTKPRKKAVRDNLPIQLLCLPTYASWLNPIEKLWRWLKQDVLHMHHLSDDWQGLKQEVAEFLDGFKYGSPELLSYVGLLPN